MNKEKLASQSDAERELAELERQIAQFEQRVELHARRGRYEGTYDHARLAELEQRLAELLEQQKPDNVREELSDG